MNIDPEQQKLIDTVGRKQERKEKARLQGEQSAWFGLGFFGMVGWSVAIPTLLFLALGIWIDSRWPTPWSFTLMLLVVGVAAGCLSAWYWIQKHGRGD